MSTTKMTMKKHEHEKNHSENITSSHIYSSHYFKNNKTIYRLSNKVYKAICKKHNAACQISNWLFLLLMNTESRQSSSQSKKNMKT